MKGRNFKCLKCIGKTIGMLPTIAGCNPDQWGGFFIKLDQNCLRPMCHGTTPWQLRHRTHPQNLIRSIESWPFSKAGKDLKILIWSVERKLSTSPSCGFTIRNKIYSRLFFQDPILNIRKSYYQQSLLMVSQWFSQVLVDYCHDFLEMDELATTGGSNQVTTTAKRSYNLEF